MALPDLPNRLPDSELLEWQQAYRLALQETNRKALFKKVEVAEAAILTRREGLAPTADHYAEWQVLEDALANLLVLKREKLNFRGLAK